MGEQVARGQRWRKVVDGKPRTFEVRQVLVNGDIELAQLDGPKEVRRTFQTFTHPATVGCDLVMEAPDA